MGFIKKMVLYEVKNHARPGDESRYTLSELEDLIQELVRVAKWDGGVQPREILDKILKEHHNGDLVIREEDGAFDEVLKQMRSSMVYTDPEFNLRKGLMLAMAGRSIDAIVCFRKQWGLGLVPAKNMAEIIHDDTRAIEILGVHGILRAVLENEAATEWRRENGFTNQCIEEDRKLYGYEWMPVDTSEDQGAHYIELPCGCRKGWNLVKNVDAQRICNCESLDSMKDPEADLPVPDPEDPEEDIPF